MPASVALLAISGADANVVVTSITLVFAMLVALCLVVTAEGKLFDLKTNRKQKQKQREIDAVNSAIAAAPTVGTPAPAPAPAAAPAPAPAADGAVAPEIVAAITAAVYALEGGGAVVHGIRRLPAGGSRRGVWGDAGVAANVRPF